MFDKTADDALKQRTVCFCAIGVFRYDPARRRRMTANENKIGKRSTMKFTAIRENHLYQKAYQKGNRFVGQTVAVFVLRDHAAKRLMLAHP